MTKSIGRYAVKEVLGSGTTSMVYLASDGADQVAIKQLHPHLAEDGVIRERFIREFEAAADLRHPSIVKVFELEEADSLPFIVMEYLEGGNLADRSLASIEEIRALAISLLEALAYSHERGVIHRNIRPENILFAEDGRAKLADFGSAHVGDLIGLTTSTMFATVSNYAAPELATGNSTDPRSDLYSVGAILTELLVGGPEWIGKIAEGLQKPLTTRISSARAALELLTNGNGPAERPAESCVYCREQMHAGLPVCIRCGKEGIELTAWDNPEAISLILRKISEEDVVFENFVFTLQCLSGDMTLAPNILTGDIRMYSREEKEKGIRPPVRIADNIHPTTAGVIVDLLQRTGATKVHVYTRPTVDLKAREKRGPLIKPKKEREYLPSDLKAIRSGLAAFTKTGDTPGVDTYTDIMEACFRLKVGLRKKRIAEERIGRIDETLKPVAELVRECVRISEYLDSVSLGEIYNAVVKINRRAAPDEPTNQTAKRIAEKAELLETYNRFRLGERNLTKLLSTLSAVQGILTGTGEALHKLSGHGDIEKLVMNMGDDIVAALA